MRGGHSPHHLYNCNFVTWLLQRHHARMTQILAARLQDFQEIEIFDRLSVLLTVMPNRILTNMKLDQIIETFPVVRNNLL